MVLGDTKGVYPEIEKISEGKPNFLDGKGMIIATFTSFMEPKEITDWFTLNNRNFLVFDLNLENSGYLINKRDIHESLFGFLRDSDESSLNLKSEDFLSVLKNNCSTSANTQTIVVEEVITEEDVLLMNKVEKKALYDKIIDNGVDKLTEHDKKILDLLVS
jgi:hypothetical protein